MVLPLSILFPDSESFQIGWLGFFQSGIYSKSESAHMVSILCSFVTLAKGFNQGSLTLYTQLEIVTASKRPILPMLHKKSVKSNVLTKDLKFQFKTIKLSVLSSSFHMPRKCKSDSATSFSNLQFHLRG